MESYYLIARSDNRKLCILSTQGLSARSQCYDDVVNNMTLCAIALKSSSVLTYCFADFGLKKQ